MWEGHFFGGPRGCKKDVQNCILQFSNVGYVYPETLPAFQENACEKMMMKSTKNDMIGGLVTLYSRAKIALFHFAKHFRMRFRRMKSTCIANDTPGFS